MNTFIPLGNQNVTAEISYWNVIDKYKIGLFVGSDYIILDKDFITEDEAYKYLNEKY